jgi:hypothetical protein
MTGAVGAEERGADELPQATSKVARPNRVARLKACRTRLDFTDNYSVAATQKNDSGIPTVGWSSESAENSL